MPAARAEASRKAPARRTAAAVDAVQLLKSDHREVEAWFEQFGKARLDSKKVDLARKICTALTVHATIEEEIFYPAFLEAVGDEDMHDEAHVEHDGAKKLIAEIEAGAPGQDMWEAKVKVLGEMIKHHVHEEEMRDGMFAKAKKSGLDLDDLGARLSARKEELMAELAVAD